MKILICSDGTAAADSAIALGKLLAAPLQAETTLLGIAEKSEDEKPLREALEKQANALRRERRADATHRAIRRTRAADCRSDSENEIRSRHYWRALDGRDRPVLAVGQNLRRDQIDRAAGPGRDRRMPINCAGFSFALAARNSSSKQCNSPAKLPPQSARRSRCCMSWPSHLGFTPILISLEEDVDRLLGIEIGARPQFVSAKKATRATGRKSRSAAPARDRDRSGLRRSRDRRLRSNRDRDIPCAWLVRSLHYGRSDPKHRESGGLSGVGGARRKSEKWPNIRRGVETVVWA